MADEQISQNFVLCNPQIFQVIRQIIEAKNRKVHAGIVLSAPAPESSKQQFFGGTWRVSTQDAECVEFEAPSIDAKGAAIGWGMGSKYSPPQPTIRGLGERIVSSPPRSPGRAPAKNDFTNF